MKDYIKKITMTAYYNDETGEIDRRSNNQDSYRVNIVGAGFKNWDAIEKLDFLKDVKCWVQEEVDKVHETLSEDQSFFHTYVMRCPDSTKQWLAIKDNPGLEQELIAKGRKVHRETQQKMFGGNVINFRRKND
jgi:hypothetical protein